MALCIINRHTNQIQYASTHNPVHLVLKGQIIEMKADLNLNGADVFEEF
jgi:hypothetical protein